MKWWCFDDEIHMSLYLLHYIIKCVKFIYKVVKEIDSLLRDVFVNQKFIKIGVYMRKLWSPEVEIKVHFYFEKVNESQSQPTKFRFYMTHRSGYVTWRWSESQGHVPVGEWHMLSGGVYGRCGARHTTMERPYACCNTKARVM